MKIKVSELSNEQLNVLVAQCQGFTATVEMFEYRINTWFTHNWERGGPIIEKEKITISHPDECYEWTATKTVKKYQTGSTKVNVEYISVVGHTPLIAAMRCYVISNLGQEVDIPE